MTTILAIDLGKFNSVFCWYDTASKAARFRTVPSTPEKIREALTREAIDVVVTSDRRQLLSERTNAALASNVIPAAGACSRDRE